MLLLNNKKYLIGAIGCMLSLGAWAQYPSEQEALLFKTYFEDSIRFGVDYFAYKNLCIGAMGDPYGYCIPGQIVVEETPLSFIYGTSSIRSDLWARFTSGRPGGDRKMMIKLIGQVVQRIRDRSYLGDSPEKDRPRMKRLIRLFRTQATVLPDFYNEIDKKYKGNVSDYVDFLFEHSMITNQKKMERFCKKPTMKLLKKDPAFKYTTSLMKYKAKILITNIENIPY